MKRILFACVVALVAGLGCGGNTNSASPFRDTTFSGKDPVAGSGGARGTTKPVDPGLSVPVFLTLADGELSSDLWVGLQKAEISGGQGSDVLIDQNPAWPLRLASLRDLNGARYLYLGQSSRGNGLARVRIELERDYRIQELSESKPKSRQFGGTNDGGGRLLLTANLDPNAGFRDAVVISLRIEEKGDERVPSLALGEAGSSLKLDRQEPRPFAGTVANPVGEGESQWFSVGPLALYAKGPEMGKEAGGLAWFSSEGKSGVAELIAAPVRGRVVGRSGDSLIVEPMAGRWADLATQTLAVAEGALAGLGDRDPVGMVVNLQLEVREKVQTIVAFRLNPSSPAPLRPEPKKPQEKK